MLLLCYTAHDLLFHGVGAQQQAKHAITHETSILHASQSIRETLNASMTSRNYNCATSAVCTHATNDSMLDRLSRRLCPRERSTAPSQAPALCVHAPILSILQTKARRRYSKQKACKHHANSDAMLKTLRLPLHSRLYLSCAQMYNTMASTAGHFDSSMEFPVFLHTFSHAQRPLLCRRGSAAHAVSSKQPPWLRTYRPKFAFHTPM